MNITKVLNYGGYQLINSSFPSHSLNVLDNGLYTVVKDDETYNLVITDIGFNGYGCLYVSFARDEYPTECWDVIEFGEDEKHV